MPMTNTERSVATVQIWITIDPNGKELWHRNLLSVMDGVVRRAEALTKDWTEAGTRALEMDIEMRWVTAEELSDHEATANPRPLTQEERIAREREQKAGTATDLDGYDASGRPRRLRGETPEQFQARVQSKNPLLALDAGGRIIPRLQDETDNEYRARVKERRMVSTDARTTRTSPAPGSPRQSDESLVEYEERMQRDVQSKPMATGSFGSQGLAGT